MAYRCKSCNESFLRKTMLDRHKCSSEESRETHSCKDCGESFNSVSVFSKHDCKQKNSETDDKPGLMKCTYCKARFTNENTLKVHMRTHTGDLPYKCQECGAKFPYHSNLRSHLRIHNDPIDRPHKCDECSAKFSQLCNLEAHLRTHGPDRTTTCNKCLCIVPENCAHTCKQETGESFYVCRECNARFTVKNTLEVHMRTHTGEKPYRCTHCGERFGQTGALQSHMRTHTLCLTHECGECSQRFRTEDELREHVRMHDHFILHKCKICFGAFANEKRLLLHMRQKHAQDEDMSQCDRCSRSFSTGSELKTHIREMHSEADSTHSHESEPDSTKHHCSKCSESFVTFSLLQLHLRCKHPCASSSYLNAEHRCEDCGCKFTTQNRLIAHRRTKHPDKVRIGRKTAPNATITSAECEKIQQEASAAETEQNKELPSECSHLKYSVSASNECLNNRCAQATKKCKLTCDIFQCKECELAFEHQYMLHIHEMEHKFVKRCKKCGSTCCCKRNESASGKRGRKARTFKCKACKRKFVGQCQLKEHKCKSRGSSKKGANDSSQDETPTPSTSNPKLYMCPECHILFSRKVLVQMHLLNVHKLTSSECSTCSKIMVQSSNVDSYNPSSQSLVCTTCKNSGEDDMEVDSTTNNDFEGESSSDDSDVEGRPSTGSDDSDLDREENVVLAGNRSAESTTEVARFKDSNKCLRSHKGKKLNKHNEESKKCLLLSKKQSVSVNEDMDTEVDIDGEVDEISQCDDIVDVGNATNINVPGEKQSVTDAAKEEVDDQELGGDDDKFDNCVKCGMAEATNTKFKGFDDNDAAKVARVDLTKYSSNFSKAGNSKEFVDVAASAKQMSLTKLVPQLITVLVGNSKLEDFGWPGITVVELLERVIRHCGEVPANIKGTPEEKLSENCKVLFAASIGKDETTSLLHEKSVEEVVVEVITLSKQDSTGET